MNALISPFATKAVAGLSIVACWAASLMLPVVEAEMLNGHTDNTDGLTILFIGWLGPMMGQFGWFANLMLIPSLGLAAGQFGRAPRRKLAVGAILLLLVLNSLFWSYIPSDAGEHRITSYLIGYWLWMASITATALWLVVDAIQQQASEQSSFE